MDVQSTERIHLPQPSKFFVGIVWLVILRPAWPSFLTIAVVRVQGPRTTSALVFSLHHEQHNGTFLRTFDTLPKHNPLLLFPLILILLQSTSSKNLRIAAHSIRITKLPRISNSIQILACRKVCCKARWVLIPGWVE